MTQSFPEPELPNCEVHQVLTGQKALVTGASSGIGKAVAIALAAAGADVLVNYLSRPREAQEVVAEIESLGRRAVAQKADVSKEDEVQTMFKRMLDEFGTIDILVNNAGLQKDAPFDEMTLDDWRLVLDVNLTGQFLCAREAVRSLAVLALSTALSAALWGLRFAGVFAPQ